jgi:tRNA(fMet)-specific endonuclease VapC
MDMLIAAHAIGLGATLVTNNEGEFKRIDGLALDTWIKKTR